MLNFDNELQAVRDASGFTEEQLLILEAEFETAYDESQTLLNNIDALWEFEDDLRSISKRDSFRDALIRMGERKFVGVLSEITNTQAQVAKCVVEETERYLESLDTLESIVHECVKNGVLHKRAPWELPNGRMFPSATRIMKHCTDMKNVIIARKEQNND
jgi:hypothetical protein